MGSGDLLNAVIVGLIQIDIHLEQIFDFSISKYSLHNKRVSSMLYSLCDTGNSFTNSSSQIEPTIWPKDFELKLYSTALLSSFCAPWPTDIVLLLNSCFLTVILLYRPASQSLLLTVDVVTCFSRHWFSCAERFGAVSFLSCKLVSPMKLSSA